MIPTLEQLSDLEFIRKNENIIDWSGVSKCLNISEYFIREFKYNISWNLTLSDKKISESFIREKQKLEKQKLS